MLLVTDRGHYFTVVEDMDDPEMVFVRSQDRESIEDVIGTLQDHIPIPDRRVSYELVDEPDWDYQFRVRLTRGLWAWYLDDFVEHRLRAHKLKPAVAEARGHRHPVSRMVEEVFYYMSHNRPGGTKPAWLRR